MAQVVDSSSAQAPLNRRARLRARTGGYPREVWLMALANLILWTGRGMISPFLVIFFSQIVGLSASLVGAGIAAAGLGGIAFVTLAAGQIDRRGGHPVLLVCLVTIALSTLVYGWATTLLPFIAVTIVLNFAGQLYWPSSDATFASIQQPETLAQAFSILRVANAVGVGLGGFVGGVIVAGGGLAQYRLLFVASGAVVLSAVLLVWKLVPAIVLPTHADGGAQAGWRALLPDTALLYAMFVMFVLVFGFTQVQMSVPAFLREEAGIGEGTIGLLFTLNTALVVVTQIPIAGWVNRANLGIALALGAVFWTLAFGCMLLTTSMGVPAAVAAFVAFTCGELLFMPSSAVIPVRLAPLHLRGRYFALASIVWGGSYAVATFAAGVALDTPRPALLWVAMGALMILGGLAALGMRRNARLAPGVA